MFMLTTFSDLVQIPPYEFYKKNRDEIEDKLNEKYANKVVPKIGLCICMYDILKASDGLIGHGTGNANVKVDFRMIVFRPYKGEIINAIVEKCTPDGIQLTTRFFDDIYVPKTMLFEDSEYVEAEKVWIWKSDGNEYFFDLGTTVRIRIETERWNSQNEQPVAAVNENADSKMRAQVPYSIEASIAEAGLGGIDWW